MRWSSLKLLLLFLKQEFGFDVNERINGTENTPLMVAIESAVSETRVTNFVHQVCQETKILGRPVDLNMKNNCQQSILW
jgi:hypothetical protein